MNLLSNIITFYIFAVGLQTILHYILCKKDLNANSIKYYMKSSLLFILILVIITVIDITFKIT